MGNKDMNAFQNIIQNCIEKEKKRILVIYDGTTEQFVDQISEAGVSVGKEISFEKIVESSCHGEEPPQDVADKMFDSDAVICLTHYSLAHTSARNELTNKGIPFLSMPDYNSRMVTNPALLTDYAEILPVVKKYSDILSEGNIVRIYTDLGTDLQLDISERLGNCCPGLVNSDYLLGSPPDIEANVAPVEDKSCGLLVIDGSITDYRLGLLQNPVKLIIKNGRIQSFETRDKKVLEQINVIFENVNSDKAYYIGELGIGFNKDAQICGNMLIDEGAKGCIHFGMGSNWTIGGANRVAFHLDFVMKNATVFVDEVKIIDKGVLLYE